jgi:hypothetical protein
MRICVLGDGSMNHVARWANYFVDKGHECFVVAWRRARLRAFHCVLYALLAPCRSLGIPCLRPSSPVL